MEQKDLKQRTKNFALRIIGLVEALPRGRTAEVIGRQLLRSNECGMEIAEWGLKEKNGCR